MSVQKKYASVSQSLIKQFETLIPIIRANDAKIQKLPETSSLEVELKIKNLGLTEFYRILDWMNNNSNFPEIEESITTDYIIDTKANTQLRFTVEENVEEIIKTTKTQLTDNIDNSIWNTRLSANIEDVQTGIFGDFGITNKDLINASLTRRKQRKSFIHKNQYFRIDITYVVNKNKLENQPTYSHECEIEFLKLDRDSIITASTVLADIFNVKQDSQEAYTEKEKADMIETLNFTLKNISGKRDGLDHTFMAPARNLKYPDIVYGGIIGSVASSNNEFGKIFKTNFEDKLSKISKTSKGKKEEPRNISYTGTIKADGSRKQFLIFNGGFWLIYPPHDFNLLGRSNDNQIKKLHGFMIDGEDVPIEKRKPNTSPNIKTKHMYIVFDLCLFPSRDGNFTNTIQEKSQLERLSIARKITDSLHIEELNLTFTNKDFILIDNTFNSLSSVVKQLEKQIEEAGYETDGMIFTPNNTVYNTLTDTLPIEKRILTRYPDICKLKPWSHQTVDLLVDKSKFVNSTDESPRRPATLMGRGYGQNIIPFEGSHYNTFDQNTQVDWSHPLFKQITSGVIMEFEPVKIRINKTKSANDDIDADDIKNYRIVLRPKQIRANKPLPNRTDYAATIWDDINDPLEVDTLEGKTFRLLRHSFNKIKKGLYDPIPEGAHLFEIGTGNGGQMSRWRNCAKILGVEPDPAHIEEMNKRLTNFDEKNKFTLKDRVKVIQGGGEETQRIVNEAKGWFDWNKIKKSKSKLEKIPPLYIVSMLSLSFFWKDLKMLNGLISTIQQLTLAYREAGGKDDVHFIFMTIEGHKVIDLFNNPTFFSGNNISERVISNNKLNGNGISERVISNNKLNGNDISERVISNNKLDITLGPCSMQLNIENTFPSLDIDIKDSIVSQQTEYLVNLEDLTDTIPLLNFKIETIPIEKCMSDSEQNYAKLFVTGEAKIGLFSESSPLKQMSTTTSSEKISGTRKKSSPEKSRSLSPEKRKSLSAERRRSVSPERERLTLENTDRINLRFTGRDDFLSRRFWNERRFHEEKDTTIETSTSEDLSAYKQNPFGFSVKNNNVEQTDSTLPVEWVSLGPLIIKKYSNKEDKSKYSLPSLLNCILSSVYPSYQKLETDEDRLNMCRDFFNDINFTLSEKTRFPSNTAQLLNPLVKGWLSVSELYPLAFNILKERDEIPEEFEFIDSPPRVVVKFYKGDNIREPHIDPRLIEIEDSLNVIKTYTKRSAKPLKKKTTPTLAVKKTSEKEDIDFLTEEIENILFVDEWLIDPEEGIPSTVEFVEMSFQWKGNFDSQEEMLDSISNEEYLAELLRIDEIDTDSIFYNCRGGYLFRYYHFNGWNLKNVQANLEIDSEYHELFEYAHIFDSLGIAMKTFSMPDQDDNNSNIRYFEPKFIKKSDNFVPNPEREENQFYTIMNRNFCIPKARFSFYPTFNVDDDIEVSEYLQRWSESEVGFVDEEINRFKNVDTYLFNGGLGNPTWGNKRLLFKTEEKEEIIPVIYTYYHHFDPEYTDKNETWEDNDTHLDYELKFSQKAKVQYLLTSNLELQGMFIPIGKLVNQLVKTIFYN
jgi:hypothetical protein